MQLFTTKELAEGLAKWKHGSRIFSPIFYLSLYICICCCSVSPAPHHQHKIHYFSFLWLEENHPMALWLKAERKMGTRDLPLVRYLPPSVGVSETRVHMICRGYINHKLLIRTTDQHRPTSPSKRLLRRAEHEPGWGAETKGYCCRKWCSILSTSLHRIFTNTH